MLQYAQTQFNPAHVVTITVPDVCQVCEQPSAGKFCTGRVPVLYGSQNGSGKSRMGQRDYAARLCQRHADMIVNYKTLLPKPKFSAKSAAQLAAQVRAGQASYLSLTQWQDYTEFTTKKDVLGMAIKATFKPTIQDKLPDTAIVMARDDKLIIARPLGNRWHLVHYWLYENGYRQPIESQITTTHIEPSGMVSLIASYADNGVCYAVNTKQAIA